MGRNKGFRYCIAGTLLGELSNNLASSRRLGGETGVILGRAQGGQPSQTNFSAEKYGVQNHTGLKATKKKHPGRVFLLVLVALQTTRLFMSSNFLERLCFDLANSFTRDSEFFTDFFEGMIHTIQEPMTHLKNLALLW